MSRSRTRRQPSSGVRSRTTRPTTNSLSLSTGRAVCASIRYAGRSTPSSSTSTTRKSAGLSLVTSIEGFRAIAARTANYRPDETEPAFINDDTLKSDIDEHAAGFENAECGDRIGEPIWNLDCDPGSREATSRTMSYFSIFRSTSLPASAGSYSIFSSRRRKVAAA